MVIWTMTEFGKSQFRVVTWLIYSQKFPGVGQGLGRVRVGVGVGFIDVKSSHSVGNASMSIELFPDVVQPSPGLQTSVAQFCC